MEQGENRFLSMAKASSSSSSVGSNEAGKTTRTLLPKTKSCLCKMKAVGMFASVSVVMSLGFYKWFLDDFSIICVNFGFHLFHSQVCSGNPTDN